VRAKNSERSGSLIERPRLSSRAITQSSRWLPAGDFDFVRPTRTANSTAPTLFRRLKIYATFELAVGELNHDRDAGGNPEAGSQRPSSQF
jgi:hypothetical protein